MSFAYNCENNMLRIGTKIMAMKLLETNKDINLLAALPI